MSKKLVVVIALGVVLSLVTAVPVSARQTARGIMDLDFNEGFGLGAACSEFTWAGTIDFRGDVYGMAFIPSAPPIARRNVFHFRDFWMIYESPFTFDENGVITECAGDPVFWGNDKGVQDNNTLKARAVGRVKGVDSAFFPEKLVGRNVAWRGFTTVTEQGLLEFRGPFAIRR